MSPQVAWLGEQLLQLRLEKGKVQREDMLLREKVSPRPRQLNSTKSRANVQHLAASLMSMP